MRRVKENDQTLKAEKENLDRIYEIAKENNFSAEYIAGIMAKVAVIGLLGDISRSLAVIADVIGKEEQDETK